jgi:hypothetical protein
MGGEALRLGPFTGGLNTTSDPSTIADVELAECINFEQDLDGSLKSRTPFKEIFGHQNFTNRVVFLCEAVFGTDHYLICSTSTGVYYFINNAFTLITATFEAGAAVQYADKVYMVPKPGSGTGGKWDPSGGFVAVAAIPKGQAAVVHKERLYVCPGIKSTIDTSRLKFSDPANLDSWPGANFIDIRQGDGNKLVDLTVYQDNLLLFKEQSTHMLSYDASPTDASLRPISDHIGVNQQYNVVNYENQVYIFSQGWVYEITNLDFLRINVKVPFVRDESVPSAFSDEFIFLSLLEDRLICRYYRKIYVYGLRTRSWSEWKSDINELHFFGPIITARPSTGNEYYAGSCLGANTTIIKLLDKQNSTDTERSFNTIALVTDTYTRVTANGLGVSDTGQTYTNSGGAAADFSTDGTKGLHTHPAANVVHSSVLNGVSVANFDLQHTFSTNKLAVGGNQRFEVQARYLSGNDNIYVSMEFTTTQTVTYNLIKSVGGVFTSIVSGTVGGLVHAANKDFTIRFKGTGGILQFKIWDTLSGQPAGWTVSVLDSAVLAAGGYSFNSYLAVGTSNSPVVFKFDNLTITNTTLLTSNISCSIKTKNFDMATSYQFKRLWWWGLDCITNNSVTGIASPITSSFVVTWDQLNASYNWDQLVNWDQPLSAPTIVQTIRATGMGVVRQFIKFDKGLRYRQISFTTILTTVGNTADGPAKVFTLTALTRPSQVVSKAVS